MENTDDTNSSSTLSTVTFPVLPSHQHQYPTHRQTLPQLLANFCRNTRDERLPSYSTSDILIPPQIVEPYGILVAGDGHPNAGSPHTESSENWWRVMYFKMMWIAEFIYRWFAFMDHDSSTPAGAQQDTAGFIVSVVENLPEFATIRDEQELDEIPPFTRQNVTIGVEEGRMTNSPFTNNIEPADENLFESITVGNEELRDEELVEIHLVKWLQGLLHPRALLTIDFVLVVRFLLSKPRQALTANSLTIFCIVVHAMSYLILCILSRIHKPLENSSSSRRSFNRWCYKTLIIAYYFVCFLAYLSLSLLTFDPKVSPSPSPLPLPQPYSNHQFPRI